MTIFGAVAGGEGDSLKNLSLHPEEGKRYARVRSAYCRESSDTVEQDFSFCLRVPSCSPLPLLL